MNQQQQQQLDSKPKVSRILVIDDEAHIAAVLSLKLRNAGFDIITAGDGEEGLDIIRENLGTIDLIITDFQMPYMTGLELCRELARRSETASIPVLMLTARGYALDEEDLALRNIREVLSKPFSPRAIVEKINAILTDGGKQGALPLQTATHQSREDS
jgi:two-component system, OmpR family, alkaline phosphatase synthesis response regulator PhoP